MKRENRYLVVKIKDIENYMTETERLDLRELLFVINNGRTLDNKRPIECVVVEHDWPEYEPTWEAIEKRMDDA